MFSSCINSVAADDIRRTAGSGSRVITVSNTQILQAVNKLKQASLCKTQHNYTEHTENLEKIRVKKSF